MVAVVSGSGLGLFNNSGAAGNSNVGRGRDQVFVNTTTGNLVVQSVDDTLAAMGLDFAAIRTYNSQGLTDEDNGDQWRLGVHQKVVLTSGTVNQVNSVVTKTFGDGSEVKYTWNATRTRYESTDGDGANDYLTWNSGNSTWTWTDGSSRNTEEYGLVGTVQRIKFSRDTDGNTVTYTYTGSLLSSIAMAGSTAQTVFFDYTDTGSAANNLRAVRVVSNGVTQTLTRYSYDSSQRLQTVTVDLTPGDNSVTDNVTYTTTYAYDGTSKRIQSITQKDGSSVAFTYQNINGDYRLRTVTDAESRVTTFTYSDVIGSGGTPATIPAISGQYSTQDTTSYPIVNGVLTAPAAGWEGASIREGLAASSNDPRIVYDSAGNGLLIWRSASNLHAQRYTRATNSWSAEVTLDSRTSMTYAPSLSIDRATGNAIAAWVQSDGTANSVYSARFNATTGTWSAAQLIDVAPAGATFPVNNASDTLVTAINGSRATIAWHHDQAASGAVYDLYVARFDGTNWLAPQLVEARTESAAQASIAIDNQGNISVAFQQSNGTVSALYVNRFTQSTGTWSGASALNSSAAINNPQIAFDANGNGLLVYRTGNDVRAQRYTRSTNTWATATEATLDARTNTTYAPVLAMDYASGNAMAVWVQSDGTANSVYAARYNVATNTWGTATLIDGAPAGATFAANATISALAASMNGTRAVVSWQHNQATSGSVFDVYAARFDGTNWLAPVLMESSVDNGASVGAAIDSSGNALVSFRQMSGGFESIFVNRFNIAAPPAYYEVPAGATWQSVAAAIYNVNSAAAGTELQTRLAPQTLATGVRLVNFPPTLSVVSTVPPYYVIVSGDTWPIITQKLYGTTNANVIAGLQAFAGTTTVPAVGQRINIQNPLQYTVGGTGASIYQRTTVQDQLGLVTTYLKDAQGRLVSVQTPAVGGSALETRYTYDPVSGNVATITQDPNGLNRVTTFTYDSVTGLLMNTRDSMGNTVARTYNANNQLETETSYLVRDPDGAGSGQPSTPLVSRYLYDSENHLRFAITADGRVTEHIYDTGPGQRLTTFVYASSTYSGTYTEALLNSWATNSARRGGALERTDYAYDFRGNISTLTRWAATTSTGAGSGAASVTRFVYDQRGMLLSTVEARGEATATPTTDYVTNYTYDGLGRSLATTAWVSGTETARLIQSNTYDDLNRRTVSTFAGGLTKTLNYNRAGELTSVVNGPVVTGTTSYTYDAGGRLRVTTDPTLVKSYMFYDDAGRPLGTVDGDGSLTEFIYNRANQVVKTVRYSTRLGATTLTNLAGGTWSSVAFATLRTEANATPAANQITRNVYDASGLLVYTVDEVGAVTQNIYDGAGRLTDQIRFFNPQSIAASIDEVLPAGITVSANASDRRVRYFYNGDGQLLGTLDGSGYLKENVYDAAGRLTTTIGYYNASDAGRWLTGTLDTLRPGSSGSVAQPDSARDITTRYFYDAQGRQVGELDGERYLTETVYDVAGQVLQSIRYDFVQTFVPGTTTFANLKSAAASAPKHTTTFTYDGLGQVLTETNFENTQTLYSYDIAGNLIATTRANGVAAEARTTATRYDALGRVTQQLTGEGSVALAGLGATPTQAQIDDVWLKYGVKYTYDDAGRRTSASVRPNDTQTNTTYYYYDNDGRLRFELDPRGRVTENRYNALGQLVDRIEYYRTVSIASPAGGLLTSALITALTGTEAANVHEKTTYGYTLRGQIASTLSAAGATTSNTYNIFGELETRTAGSGFTPYELTYDARGLQKLTRRAGLTFETRTYDAFGRLSSVVDARNNTFSTTYDRLGREITSTDPGDTNARVTTYDAFSRVLSVRDKLLNTTGYAYNDTTKSVTMTTPESVVVTTTHNAHGETVTVVAAGNTTTYQYDRNGQLKTVSDSLGALEGRTYDRTGRQVTATDERGSVTTFAYDAANRILSRTVTPPVGSTETLNLVTTYSYDPQNRILDVTEPGNRLTRTEYDRDGRVYRVTVDPNGTARSQTEYAYDAANNTILVTEGVGTTAIRRTQYKYDVLGRRIEEIVDPTALGGSLNLRTIYKYDNNDNVTRKIDARYIEGGPAPFNNALNYSTWYVYDAQNRLTQTVDALGGVTQLSYDAEDRVVTTRRFATTVSTSAFGDAIASQSIATTVNDQVSRSVYDRDGREKYTLATASATGSSGNVTELAIVTERTFDANGNVTRTRVYRNTITVPGTVSTTTVSGQLTVANGNDPVNVHADDHVAWTVYDLRGRAIYTVNGDGGVTKSTYDLSGNVIATVAYADRIVLANLMPEATLTTFVNGTAGSNTANRTTRFWYDSLNRPRFALDAEGYLTESRYLDSTNQELSVVYATKPTIAVNATLTDVMNAAPANAANQSTTQYFDAAGRVIQVTDADSKSEYFGYDALGNKTKYVNKKAASAADTAFTWTYEYDANGRLINERSPVVPVTTIDPSTLTASVASLSLVTHNDYDALGNVTARTEAYGTSQARITSYEYDLLGRQTATLSPTVGIYNVSGDAALGNGTAVTPTEDQARIISETAYDVFGNAFRNRLVTSTDRSDTARGTYTYKAYDTLGRVTAEVDANNQVTGYLYDVFGNKQEVTRYNNTITPLSRTAASLVSSQVTPQAHALDRKIESDFNRLGLATSIRQPSVRNFAPTPNAPLGTYYDAQPTTENVYNAFGDVVRTSTRINSTEWAHTYLYYNKLGQKSAVLDPGRYLTQFEYDETGDLKRQVEYARPTTGTINYNTFGTIVTTTNAQYAAGSAESFAGYDREITIAYDKLNRKITETRLNLEFGSINGSGVLSPSYTGTQTTSYGYDALGNLTKTSDTYGATSFTFYDVLGRVVAVAGPARDVGQTAPKISFTRMQRDAHGNLVQQIEYYNGLAANAFGATPPAAPALPATPATHAEDRTTTMLVDLQGNARRTRDATGAERNASYNMRGDIAKEWQVVTNAGFSSTETIVKIYRYDAVGQTKEVVETQRYNGASTESVTRVAQYNAFGEIIYKYNAGTADAQRQYFDYDQAGRVWRTNSEDGVVKVYMYDLAGNATLELRANGASDITGNSTNLDAGRTLASAGTFTTAQSVVDGLAATRLMRTETVFDVRGNVIERRMPTFDAASVFQPAATAVQLGLVGGVTYLSWVPNIPVSNSAITRVFYKPLGAPGDFLDSIDFIETLAGGRVGVNVNNLYGRTFEFRITTRFNGEQIPIAESNGSFHFDRTSTTNASFPTVTVDAASQVGTIGNQTSGMIVWTAPTDGTVSARMRFNGGSWITATRPSGNFQVDARTALAIAGSYTWEINYLRGSTVVAAKTGTLNSSGNSTGRTIVVSGTGNTTPGPYNGTIPGPEASGQDGARVLAWRINNASVTETGGLTVDVQYRRVGTGTYSGPVQVTWTGSVWSWNVASLDTGVGTDNYDYIVTLRAGNRAIATQNGTFTLTDRTTTETVTLSLDYNFQPTAAPAVGTVVGTGGGNTVTWSNIRTQNPAANGYWGNEWFNWNGTNSIRPSWTGSQDTAYVLLDYVSLGGSMNSFYAQWEASWLATEMPVAMTMTRNVDNVIPGINPNQMFSMGDIGPGGIDYVRRIRVYTSQGGTLIADSDIPNPAGRTITWAAPQYEPTTTAKVFWDNGGTWALLGDATWNNFTFSISVDSVPVGTRNIKIEYTRAGENWASTTAILAMTQTTGAPVLGAPSNSNHDPSWINTFSGGSDGSLHWTGQVESGGRVQIEEWNMAQQRYDVLQTWYSGSSFAYDFSGRTPTQSWATHFVTRVRYFGSNAWATSWAQVGVATLRTSSTTAGNISASVSGSQVIQAAVIAPTVNASGISWTYAKQNASDRVRFRYWTEGEEAELYDEDLSGTSSFNSTFPQMISQSARIYWMIEYLRPGETNSYARASGNSLVDINYTTTFASSTITGQTHVYPSTVTPIPTPTYRASDRAVLFTTTANSLSDIKFFLDGSATSLTVSAEGAGYKVILPTLTDGNHTYNIVYQSGSQNPYARVSGTFTTSTSTSSGTNFSVTQAAQRPDAIQGVVPGIGRISVPQPPYAVYHLELDFDGSDIPTGTSRVVYGAMPWAPAGTHMAGGYYATNLTTETVPLGPTAQLPQGTGPNQYSYQERLSITIDPIGDLVPIVEYWSTSNPSVVTVAAVTRPFGYWLADINGLANGTYGYRVRMVRDGGSIPLTGAEGTFTVASTSTITVNAPVTTASAVTPTTKQSYDRWGNVIKVTDASNNITDYRYNGLNLLVQTLEAQDYIFDKRDAAGSKATDGILARAEKRNYYDLLGRLIETQDGYGQAIRASYDAAGNQISKRNADYARHTNGATSYNLYDIFGQLLQTTDELGYLARFKYDKIGRLTAVWRELDLTGINRFSNRTDANDISTTGLVQGLRYTYDEAGRRIADTNGANEITRYRYDLLGNLTTRRSNLGSTTTYRYDADGRKTNETDAIGSAASWAYDAFGRLTSHTEFSNAITSANFASGGGLVINYTYDFAGHRLTQSGGGQSVRYQYDRAGQLSVINDSSVNRRTYYTYDAAGRQARESVVIDGRLHQDTKITYDAHNRIKAIEDPDYRQRILYDVNGNRAYIAGAVTISDLHASKEKYTYTYDEMNRVTQSSVFFDDKMSADTTSYVYNARGDRVRQVTPHTPRHAWEVVGSGYRYRINNPPSDFAGVAEAYSYDGLGRLLTVHRNLYEKTSGTQNLTDILVRSYGYDLANRQTFEQVRSVESPTSFVTRSTSTGYNGDGQTMLQVTTKYPQSGASFEESRVNYGTGRSTWNSSTQTWSLGFDDANNLRAYDATTKGSSSATATTTNYTTFYNLADGYQENRQRSQVGNQWAETLRTYNVNHELTKVSYRDSANSSVDLARTRYFANNQAGQVLTVIQTPASNTADNWDRAILHTTYANPSPDPGKAQAFFFVNNNQVGAVGLVSSNEYAVPHFEVNATPISDNYPAATPATVIVQAGDTLRTIAARVFGDASLWYILADENGLTDPDAALTAGSMLRVPNNVLSLSNTADSFKPYNVADALGDTTPTVPPPPAAKGCGVIGMIIMIVVMVVVTIFTAGVAAGALGAGFSAIMSAGATALTTAIGAVGGLASIGTAMAVGAVSSVVTQGIGMALGIQKDFDWKQVAMGAVTAGVGGVIAKAGLAVNTGSKMFNLAANAAISNAATQGVAVAVGIQEKFDWKSVAQSAVAAPLAAAASKFVGNQFGGELALESGRYNVTKFATDAASRVTTAAVRSAMGGRFDVKQVVADVFGNAIGNAIVSGFANHGTLQSLGLLDAPRAKQDMALFLHNKGLSNDQIQRGFADANIDRLLTGKQEIYDRLGGRTFEQAIQTERGRADAADALIGTYGYEVRVESLGSEAIAQTRADQITPNELLEGQDTTSTMFKLGRGASFAIDKITGGLSSAVKTLGPENVEFGIYATQFIFGGIPKTAVNIALDKSLGDAIREVAAPLKQAFSEFLATRAFDARNESELAAVMPATNALSTTALEFAIGAITNRGSDKIVAAAADFGEQRGLSMVAQAAKRVEQAEVRAAAAQTRAAASSANAGAASNAARESAARLSYMGRTPDKFSRTGREVVNRMRENGDIVGNGPLLRGNPNNLMLRAPDGTLHRIDDTIDMGHKTDAVTWWNETGRNYGPKSPEVRKWMLDPNNYELQLGSLNRSAGASLGVQYLPPLEL